jgi:hypothetical protein
MVNNITVTKTKKVIMTNKEKKVKDVISYSKWCYWVSYLVRTFFLILSSKPLGLDI